MQGKEAMYQELAEQTPISEVMHQDAYCVNAHQSVGDIVSFFLDHGINAAPVVDDSGILVGFVSKTDIVRELQSQDAATGGERGQEVQPWWDTDRLSQFKVCEIMSPTFYTFSPSTPVADATATMAFEGLHHVPVVSDSGQAVGMLSALDVLNWLVQKAGYQPAHGRDGKIFKRPV